MSNPPKLQLALGQLSRADGSARFALGRTIALASVTGPIEVRAAWEKPGEATLEVNVRPLEGIAATQARAAAQTIKAALMPSLLLARAPRTLIQLTLQCLSSSILPPDHAQSRLSLSTKAALINASTAAFLDAGSVSMRGVVCACAVGMQRGELVLDPAETDEAGGFGFMFEGDKAGELVWVEWMGKDEEWERVAQEGRRGAAVVRDFLRGEFERTARKQEPKGDVDMG